MPSLHRAMRLWDRSTALWTWWAFIRVSYLLGKLGEQQPGKGSDEQGERAVLSALRLDPKLRGTKTRVLRMTSQLSSVRTVRHGHFNLQ